MTGGGGGGPECGQEDTPEPRVRPATLAEFGGPRQLRDNLSVFIEAARARSEALDHVLFFGPPGLGKTTLAQIVARNPTPSSRARCSITSDSVGWYQGCPRICSTVPWWNIIVTTL